MARKLILTLRRFRFEVVFIALLAFGFVAHSQFAYGRSRDKNEEKTRILVQPVGLHSSSVYPDSIRRVLKEEYDVEVSLQESVTLSGERLQAHLLEEGVKNDADYTAVVETKDFDELGQPLKETSVKIIDNLSLRELYEDMLPLDERFEELFRRSLRKYAVNLNVLPPDPGTAGTFAAMLKKYAGLRIAKQYLNRAGIEKMDPSLEDPYEELQAEVGEAYYLSIAFENVTRHEQHAFNVAMKNSRLSELLTEMGASASRFLFKRDPLSSKYRLVLNTGFKATWYQNEVASKQKTVGKYTIIHFEPFLFVMDQILRVQKKLQKDLKLTPSSFDAGRLVLLSDKGEISVPVEMGEKGNLVQPYAVDLATQGDTVRINTASRSIYEKYGLFVVPSKGKSPAEEVLDSAF